METTPTTDTQEDEPQEIIQTYSLQDVHDHLKGLKKKVAIVQLIILNDKYVLGAIINAYVHQRYLQRIGIRQYVDLVVMVEENIFE